MANGRLMLEGLTNLAGQQMRGVSGNLNKEKYGIPSASTNPKDLIGARKLSMCVLPDVAVAHANHAMSNGARKYGPYNWREKSVGATTYINAARRHLAQWYDGQEVAEDSEVHHLGHAMACLAILLDAQEAGGLIDDRPKGGGGFNRVLERLNEKVPDAN
jgi:hypothetical protein